MFKIFLFSMRNNIRLFYIVISVIVITLVMIALLGNAIGQTIESGVYSVEKIAVYNDLDDGYKQELDGLLEAEELSKITEIEYIDSTDNIEELLEDEVYHTIFVGEETDGKNNIKIYTVYSESYMLSIASSYVKTANAVSMVIEKAPQAAMEIIDGYDDDNLKTIEAPKGSPGGIDYYGVLTMLQMVSLLCLISIYTVLDDKTKNIHPRVMTLPVSRTKVIIGRALADVVMIWVVIILIAVSSHYILGANWSGNYFMILTVFLIFSIIVVLLGMICARIANSVIGALGIAMGFGTVIWPRLSSSFSPYQSKSALSFISPSYHAKNALFAALYSDSWSVILEGLLGMSVIAVIMLAFYVVLERRSVRR